MQKRLLILLFCFAAFAAFAQQSNKSKSKDRYREKDLPAQSDVQDAIDQLGTLRALAEQELPLVLSTLTEVLQLESTASAMTSRYYAYALLAGYETTARYQPKVSSLRGMVNGMPAMLSFTPADSVFHPFASLYAILETGKQLLPNGSLLLERQTMLEQTFRQHGLPDRTATLSKTAAQDIARAVLEYAQTDGFQRIADLTRGRTGINPVLSPDLAQSMDPSGNALRPFLLESTQPFALPDPMPFDTSASSAFMAQVREVYNTGKNATADQRAIAEFWDGNGLGKTSLPGHWMAICGSVCNQQKMAFNQALHIHTAVALGMADAYSVYWEENLRNKRPRPQTMVNRLLDATWRPHLQGGAPLEYASDHSIVSAAAAEVLTRLVGEKVAFADESSVPLRRYTSFRQAAEEAAMSRLYGGLQLRDALEAGLASGKRVGNAVVLRWPKVQ